MTDDNFAATGAKLVAQENLYWHCECGSPIARKVRATVLKRVADVGKRENIDDLPETGHSDSFDSDAR